MMRQRILSVFLLLLFFNLHAAVTLSWVQKISLPVVLEEEREHTETEEDVTLSLDIIYVIEKNQGNNQQLPFFMSPLLAGFLTTQSGRIFIPDHYSPPEHFYS
jgi:hypothetical protein